MFKMDVGPASSSHEALDVDFDFSFGNISGTTSLKTWDSGLSLGTLTESENSWCTENRNPALADCCNLAVCFEAQNLLICQAVNCLLGSDTDCILNASVYLFQLCKSGYSHVVTTSCPGIVEYLHQCLIGNSALPIDCWHFLSGIVHYLSLADNSIDLLLVPNAIHILCELLQSSIDSVLYYAITALHNLLLSRTHSRDIIRKSHIVNQLVNLLHYPKNAYSVNLSVESEEKNPKFMAIMCDCLHILAYGHEPTKIIILEGGGISSLMELVKQSRYENFLFTASRLIRVLSAWTPAKLEFITHDSNLTFFSYCLNKDSTRSRCNSLWALRNISDVAVDRLDAKILHSVTELLISQLFNAATNLNELICGDLKDEFSICRCILGILANFTCRNHSIKSLILHMNGLDALTRILFSVLKAGRIDVLPRESSASCRTTETLLSHSLSQLSLRNSVPLPARSAFSSNHHRSARPVHESKTQCYQSVPCTPTSRVSTGTDQINRRDSVADDFVEVGMDAVAVLFPEAPLPPITSIPYSQAEQVTTRHSAKTIHSDVLTDHNANHHATTSVTSIAAPTVDLLEAGFRCLSHLTAGYEEAPKAIAYLLNHQQQQQQQQQRTRSPGPLLLRMSTDVVLHLLSTLVKAANSPLDRTGQSQLQLVRAWATLYTNLCCSCSRAEVNGRLSATVWPSRETSGQMRRSLRTVTRHLRRLCDVLPDRPKELATSLEAVSRITRALSK